MQQSSHTRAYIILVVGLLAGSLAAIFTRYAENDGVPALVIAAGRLTLGTLALTPFILSRYAAELRALTRRDVLFAAAAGFWLALHFILYISGLEYTSVLVSVVLGATAPLWSALFELVFLKGRMGRAMWAGLGLAFLGVLCIAAASGGTQTVSLGQEALFGSILGLLASIASAVYLTIGRKMRGHISAMPYIYLVFGFAALTALVVVAFTGTPVTGYPASGYLWIVMLTIFPQLIAHSSFNIVLNLFSATYIGLTTQTQIVIAVILAYFLFNEVPMPLQIIGGLAIIGGVVIATLGQQQKPITRPLSENPIPAPTGD